MSSTIRILCIGDVIGKPGRVAIHRLLPDLIDRHHLDLVIANAENAAGGIGLTTDVANELFSEPINMLTSGNHIWRHREIIAYLDKEPRLLRPFNLPENTPGKGYGICKTSSGIKVGVICLLGQIFMEAFPSPFDAVLKAIAALEAETSIIVVDMHAEATSEKRAMGWLLDGRASAVFGTHTHVLTADEEILPKGTGYITDIGMTGPFDSVIGMKKELILERFLTMRPAPFVVAKGNVRLCGAIFEIDSTTGHAVAIQRVNEPLDSTNY
ncbi:MAG: TIGR00282 family metallophosphoesterase [Pseudomonadota bacterium]